MFPTKNNSEKKITGNLQINLKKPRREIAKILHYGRGGNFSTWDIRPDSF